MTEGEKTKTAESHETERERAEARGEAGLVRAEISAAVQRFAFARATLLPDFKRKSR